MITDFQLTELMQSKFFHDVAGPIGAINNGIEFLSENRSDVQKKAAALMAISSEELINKMNFYRSAFGFSQMTGEDSLDRAIYNIEHFYAKNKIKFEWNNFPTQELYQISNKFLKMLYNVIYVTASNMIYGGEISCDFLLKENNIKLKVVGKSLSGIKIDRDIASIIVENNDVVVNSKNVHLYYFKRFCRINEVSVSADISDQIIFNLELHLNNSVQDFKEEISVL